MAYIVDGPEELAGELLGGRLFLTRVKPRRAIAETIFNHAARAGFLLGRFIPVVSWAGVSVGW